MPPDYWDADWLERKYHDEGLTQREIAEACGVATSTIRRRMKRYGIETREVKGENHGMYGKTHSAEVKRKISAELTGRTFSQETLRRMSEAQSGRRVPDSVREKISKSLLGLDRSVETRVKMSRSTAGDRNPNWRGGDTRRYGAGWTIARERVLARDEVCQHCGHVGSEHRLHVHHIVPVRVFRESEDLELEAAHDEENLILLCNPCHGRVEQGQIELR